MKWVEIIVEFLKQTYIIALPIILGYIVWLLQTQKTERVKADKRQETDSEAQKEGIMLLLRVQLIEYHDKYMERGEIPSYAYENFCAMYDAYHKLGGNGMITKMFEEIKELNIKTKGD